MDAYRNLRRSKASNQRTCRNTDNFQSQCTSRRQEYEFENEYIQPKTNINEGKQQNLNLVDFKDYYIESEYCLVVADYYVNCTISIGISGKLTIQPGTRLFFNKDAGIICEGQLIANGTVQNPILFSAAGNAKWNNVSIAGKYAKDSQITYCNFENGSGIKPNESQLLHYFDYEDECFVKDSIGGC
ncbi:MAG: hypothetical protein K8S87_08455 [Planctomycetes bacterium]|nr:hypothetical protein [Planctomycetota bacterium]